MLTLGTAVTSQGGEEEPEKDKVTEGGRDEAYKTHV